MVVHAIMQRMAAPKDKIARFKVTDPSLSFFIHRYENSIPWEKITSAEDIQNHIRTSLLPDLIALTDPQQPVNAYYNPDNLSEEFAANPRDPQIQEMQALYRQGEGVVRAFIDQIINKQKRELYSQWIQYITKDNDLYNQNPATQYLFLQPIVYSSNPRQLPPDVNAEIIAKIYDNIQETQGAKPFNFLKVYRQLQKQQDLQVAGMQGDFSDGWLVIPSKLREPEKFRQNAHLLKSLSAGNGWCTAYGHAEIYLATGDFHMYIEGGTAQVAIRLSGSEIGEIRGRFNEVPVEHFEVIRDYFYKNGWNTNHPFYAEMERAWQFSQNFVVDETIRTRWANEAMMAQMPYEFTRKFQYLSKPAIAFDVVGHVIADYLSMTALQPMAVVDDLKRITSAIQFHLPKVPNLKEELQGLFESWKHAVAGSQLSKIPYSALTEANLFYRLPAFRPDYLKFIRAMIIHNPSNIQRIGSLAQAPELADALNNEDNFVKFYRRSGGSLLTAPPSLQNNPKLQAAAIPTICQRLKNYPFINQFEKYPDWVKQDPQVLAALDEGIKTRILRNPSFIGTLPEEWQEKYTTIYEQGREERKKKRREKNPWTAPFRSTPEERQGYWFQALQAPRQNIMEYLMVLDKLSPDLHNDPVLSQAIQTGVLRNLETATTIFFTYGGHGVPLERLLKHPLVAPLFPQGVSDPTVQNAIMKNQNHYNLCNELLHMDEHALKRLPIAQELLYRSAIYHLAKLSGYTMYQYIESQKKPLTREIVNRALQTPEALELAALDLPKLLRRYSPKDHHGNAVSFEWWVGEHIPRPLILRLQETGAFDREMKKMNEADQRRDKRLERQRNKILDTVQQVAIPHWYRVSRNRN